ncbi:phage tail protein, partial [Pseudomonas sp. Sample_9]|uniref:phage tail-collar fiber domain-containing protein n=1 Tax=Pseudomonas sp. Sample_9 TaxID=2382158 RepID=UPI001032914A
VANCAPSFKPLLSQGSGRTQIVRMNFIVTSTGNIQLKIDPAVVLATRSYVDAAILEVLPKNKTPGEFTRVKVNDRGIFVSGDNPETLAAMGIKDSYTKEEIEALVAQATESKRGTAKVATQVEVDAGADDAKFVTAKKLFGGFGMTVGQNGFIRLPSWLGGFTIQWGLNTVASNGDCVITLPTNYNTKHFQILSIAGAITGMAVAYTAISLSGAVIPHYVPSTGAKAGGGYNCVWISFGK